MRIIRVPPLMKVGLIEQTFVTPGEKVIFFLGGGGVKSVALSSTLRFRKSKQIAPLCTYTHVYTNT